MQESQFGLAGTCATSPSQERRRSHKVDDGLTNGHAGVIPAQSKRGLN
jgi:L-serine deaminase